MLGGFYELIAPGIVVRQSDKPVSLAEVMNQLKSGSIDHVYHQISEDHYFGHLNATRIDGYDVVLLPDLAEKREEVLSNSGKVVFTTKEAHKPATIDQDFLDSEYLAKDFFDHYFRSQGIDYRRLEAHEIKTFGVLSHEVEADNAIQTALERTDTKAISLNAPIRAVFDPRDPGKVNLAHPAVQRVTEGIADTTGLAQRTVTHSDLLEVYFCVVTMRLPEAIQRMEELMSNPVKKAVRLRLAVQKLDQPRPKSAPDKTGCARSGAAPLAASSKSANHRVISYLHGDRGASDPAGVTS